MELRQTRGTIGSLNGHRLLNEDLCFWKYFTVCLIVGPTWASELSIDSPIIDLDNAVYFLTAEGSDVVVPPGTHQVEAVESWLRVIPGERHEPR